MSFNDLNIREYIEKLASKEPVPGGGGASAVCGALGAALASMVCNLTIGKKKFAEYEGELTAILNDAQRLSAELLHLSDEDARVRAIGKGVFASKTLPRNEHRDKVMEQVLLEAAEVPLNIMRVIAEVIKLHHRLKDISSMLAISDVGCGIIMAKAHCMRRV